MPITITLTSTQHTILLACANAAQMTVEDWVLSAALARAAQTVDILQRDERRYRMMRAAANKAETDEKRKKRHAHHRR